jgi:hypothetical protein
VDPTTPDDEWIGAIKKGTKSRGSFEQVAPLAEAVTLATIALRVPYKRLLWNGEAMQFTNSADANKLVRRQQFRDGWEKITS